MQICKDIDNLKVIIKCLNETKNNYRPLDPGLYLYRELMKFSFDSKISNDFIELAYTTLKAWNMDSRRAKLEEYKIFKKSIMDNKRRIIELNNYSLKDIECSILQDKIKYLFYNLRLAVEDNPPIVSFSKTLHFILPELVVPIDRKYTLKYFHTTINKDREKQFDDFIRIEKAYNTIAQKRNWDRFIDNKWNTNIPKIMDNIAIGYVRLYGKDAS